MKRCWRLGQRASLLLARSPSAVAALESVGGAAVASPATASDCFRRPAHFNFPAAASERAADNKARKDAGRRSRSRLAPKALSLSLSLATSAEKTLPGRTGRALWRRVFADGQRAAVGNDRRCPRAARKGRKCALFFERVWARAPTLRPPFARYCSSSVGVARGGQGRRSPVVHGILLRRRNRGVLARARAQTRCK